jgi:hypothetical protein
MSYHGTGAVEQMGGEDEEERRKSKRVGVRTHLQQILHNS